MFICSKDEVILFVIGNEIAVAVNHVKVLITIPLMVTIVLLIKNLTSYFWLK